MNLGFPEIVVLFCLALLVFGPKRLPELAKTLGKGMRDFKRAMNGEADDTVKPPASEAPVIQPPPETQPTFAHGTKEAEPDHKKTS